MPSLAFSSLSTSSKTSLILMYYSISFVSFTSLLLSPFFLAFANKIVHFSMRSTISSKLISSSSLSWSTSGLIISLQILMLLDNRFFNLGMFFCANDYFSESFSRLYISKSHSTTSSIVSRPYISSYSLKSFCRCSSSDKDGVCGSYGGTCIGVIEPPKTYYAGSKGGTYQA